VILLGDMNTHPGHSLKISIAKKLPTPKNSPQKTSRHFTQDNALNILRNIFPREKLTTREKIRPETSRDIHPRLLHPNAS